MQKLFDFLEKYMMGPMGKLSQKQFVRAIMAAGMGTIPFTIIGSAFLILNVLPQVFPALEGIWAASFDKITNLYMTANTFTMGVLALYFNIIMGFELTSIKANEYDLNLSPITGAMLSMMAFLMTIAEMVIVDGTYVFVEGEGYISGIAYGSFANRLGTSGIFTGILMATLAVWIYKTCVQRNWTIKLPDAVPLGVSRSFTALIPCAAIVFVVLVLNGLIMLTGYDLFNIIAIPFSFVGSIADTWYGVLIINLLIHALWSVGIHGANIISAFYSPFTLQNFKTNAEIFTGKATGDYAVFAGEFQNMYVVCGGSGATLGMCIWMAFCAKSEQLKALGVASLPSGIFNINEPLIFGVPIIYNPNLIIPYILAPTVAAEIAYFGIASGIFPPVIANVPWPTPGLLGAFIGTGGNFMGAVLALICITVAFLIYFPFLTKYDSQLVKEEAEATAA
ncbi:PTS cellobiose transporter subunit IIC [Ileibacterium valens]|uniref:PTS cellobiose transporter subunit IIC n=1 Tax=Ileibacterium valens TaxID=1862668 RepID=UPI00272C8E60|nr:PTS cellobiose transporter subunit IIC [Ileibacterium valens]